MSEKYDVIILGGGPGGYAAALQASRSLKVLLMEPNELGGTCLNVGCIPTKALLASAGLLKHIRKASQQNILGNPGGYSFGAMQAQKQRAVDALVSGLTGSVSRKVKVVRAFGRIESSGTVSAYSPSGELVETYLADSIIIATGSRPSAPPIPGAQLEGVMDSTDALALNTIPKALTIIGAGVIGLEFAGLYSALGTRVRVLEAQDEILPGEDRAAVSQLTASLERDGVEIQTACTVKRISGKPGGMRVSYNHDGDHEAACDLVLMAAGREPVLDTLGPVVASMDREGKYLRVDEFMRTSVPGIYAVGDITPGPMLAHNAYAKASIAAGHILGGNETYDASALPRCIYTYPQLAAVGMSLDQAEQAGIAAQQCCTHFRGVGMAVACGEEEGFVKIIYDAQGKLLGISIVGAHAAEMICTASTLLSLKATVSDLRRIIFPHPTYGEAFHDTAMNASL